MKDHLMTAWLSLSTLLVFSAVIFGLRSVMQRRRTGSAGFRGISGRFGSAEWFGGTLFVVAIALAVLAPVLVLAGVSSPASLSGTATAVGGVLMLIGSVVTVLAQLSMGDSWRIGVDPTERTALVQGGLFRLSRNPIFTGMLVFLAGHALVLPTLVSVLALAAAFVGIELQVRLVEEPYLQRTHGESYARYTASVGRFLPLIGRLPSTSAPSSPR